MVVAQAAGRVDVYRAENEAPLPHWPLTLMVSAYPVWFLLGLGGFMWVLLAAPMAASLVRRRDLAAPKGIGLWVVFLVAVAGSALSIENVDRFAGYLLRFGYYAAATVFLLYLLNGGSGVSVPRIVRAFTVLWSLAIVGGYLALLLGDVSFRSPTYYLLPASLVANDLIGTLVEPGFAQVQNIIGFPAPRPKAPFPYTNSWGSMVALTTPFAFMALGDRQVGISPRLIKVMLWLSVVPIVVSLNRGLWLSLGIGVTYAAFRFGAGGRTRTVARLAVVVVAAAVALAISPLGDLVASRVGSGHSNGDRFELVAAALRGAAERPIFGWGAPRPNVRNLPSIGTHGQLWLVTFSHGFVGAIGFVGALVTFFVKTRRQSTATGLWAHSVLLIALVQLPVYLLIPHSLFAVMAAVAIALRSQR
ncbi:MAG: O-antigen ligase family protein [Acidimicrobiales bacterium]